MPWANLLAGVVNTPFEAMGELDKAMRHSRFEREWDASQTMGPMLPAMGLALRAPYATTQYAGLMLAKAGQAARGAALAPMWWFLGAGGPGGGFFMAPPSRLAAPVGGGAGIRLSRNAFKRILGVERTFVEFLLRHPGSVSVGRELYFDVILPDGSTTLLILDELFRTPSGRLVSAESKFGWFAKFHT